MSGARVPALRPEQLDEDQRALRDKILSGPRASGSQAFDLADGDGRLDGPFAIFLHAPALGSALADLGERLRFCGALSDRCREIAILAVAAACDSDFEWYAHFRIARRVGLSEDEIADVRAGRPCSADPREVLVQDAARCLVAQERPDPRLAHALVERLGPSTVLELVALIGYYRMLAQLLDVFGVSTPVAGSHKEEGLIVPRPWSDGGADA